MKLSRHIRAIAPIVAAPFASFLQSPDLANAQGSRILTSSAERPSLTAFGKPNELVRKVPFLRSHSISVRMLL
jgi:hypothetical protein